MRLIARRAHAPTSGGVRGLSIWTVDVITVGKQPCEVRRDNGPEFIADTIQDWLEAKEVSGDLYQAGQARY